MAEKISVEIGLDGGTEVERQLDNIGKAGQKAFGDIQSAADQVNLDSTTSQFDNLGTAGQAAFQKVQAAAQSATAFEQVVQGVKKVEGAFESLGTAVAKIGTRMTRSLGVLGVAARALGPLGIALGVVGGAFVKFGDDSADAINALTAAGAKLGQTPQQLDRLQKAFGQLGVAPDAIISGMEKFQSTIGGALGTNLSNFIAQLESMPDGVQRTQLAMEKLGDSLGAQVIAGLQTGAISAKNFTEALAGVTTVTQQQIVDAAKYQQALNQLNAAWTELKAAFVPIATPLFALLTEELKNLRADIQRIAEEFRVLKALWELFKAPADQQAAAAQRVVEAYRQVGQAGRQAAQQAKDGADASTLALGSTSAAAAETTQQLAQVGAAGEQAGSQVAAGMQTANSGITGLLVSINGVVMQFDRVAESAQRAARFIANLDRPTMPFIRPDPIGGHASGGLLGGRGSGTSDSNLAWVSRGEHIMPARAVGQPGVLAFLEALRRSGGNLRGVLDGMGRFALGGLVPRPAMAFAGGGAVGGTSNVTINFPGLPPIGGLRASDAVVDELRKAAAMAQVRSGGRKPSRYS